MEREGERVQINKARVKKEKKKGIAVKETVEPMEKYIVCILFTFP